MSLTIDASVWIAAADPSDKFHSESRALLRRVVMDRLPVAVPAFAVTEVACALARRLRDGAQGRQLTHALLDRIVTVDSALDGAFLTAAESLGTQQFLRGADALYAVAAQLTTSTLISWDEEHLQRARGVTPADWLTANP